MLNILYMAGLTILNLVMGFTNTNINLIRFNMWTCGFCAAGLLFYIFKAIHEKLK